MNRNLGLHNHEFSNASVSLKVLSLPSIHGEGVSHKKYASGLVTRMVKYADGFPRQSFPFEREDICNQLLAAQNDVADLDLHLISSCSTNESSQRPKDPSRHVALYAAC